MGAGIGLYQAHAAAEERALGTDPELVTEAHAIPPDGTRADTSFFARRISKDPGRLGRH
jgi:hypothetical protein